VYTGLRAQPAESVFTLETYGRALDPGDVAGGGFDQLGLEAAAVTPLQVHAQQHLRPVLRFGAARSRLDIEEGIVAIGIP